MSHAVPLHRLVAVLALGVGALVITGCKDRETSNTTVVQPVPTTPTTPPATPTPTTASSDPAPVPGKGTDVANDKGTETGMIGGASGTTASGGKPGSGTVEGAGTGPAQNSGERTENKK